jgi:hypothetical protein
LHHGPHLSPLPKPYPPADCSSLPPPTRRSAAPAQLSSAPTTGENVLRVQQPGDKRGVAGRWAARSFGGSGAAQHRRVEGVGPGVAVVPVRDGDGSRRLTAGRMQELSRGGCPTQQMRSGQRDVDGDDGGTGGRRASWMSAGARGQELDAGLQPSGRQAWSPTASAVAAIVDRKNLDFRLRRSSLSSRHACNDHPSASTRTLPIPELRSNCKVAGRLFLRARQANGQLTSPLLL